MNRIAMSSLSVWMLLSTASTYVFAQCEDKSGFAKQACQVQANSTVLAGQASLDTKSSPLTTTFADTIHQGTLPPSMEPKSFRPLTALPRTDDGAFILGHAGIFEVYAQSYTLEVNDSNATKPGGYFPAPILGRRAKIIASLLKQVELHPDVPQADIQTLLLAIVQGADLEKMPPAMQQTAARVLPKDTLTQLQGATQARAAERHLLDLLNQRMARNKAANQTLGQINNTETQISQNTAGVLPEPTFKDAASAAEPVARGTWAQMPGGFYVRYLPDGYMRTRVQVIVPDAAVAQADPKNPLTFDPTQYLAVLSIAPGERIGVTLRTAR
jgi:hypothetical protein